ncbi:MAG: DNA mismatch repair protein MutS, partial [Bacillota bacterium]|nr:DNA mismatch repair protein MutS [Bacillota bacterium]
ELPKELINRAAEILKELEEQPKAEQVAKVVELAEEMPKAESVTKKESLIEETAQLSFFEEEPKETKKHEGSPKERKVLENIKALNILDMTPLQAMNALYELQKKLKS